MRYREEQDERKGKEKEKEKDRERDVSGVGGEKIVALQEKMSELQSQLAAEYK